MSAHRISLAASEAAFSCDAQDTVLRAAQRSGLAFPYECNVGSCGNCRFELVSGEMHDAWPQAPALSDKDRQRGRRLGCQSQPRSDCVIKLRPMERYRPVHPPVQVTGTLVERRALTHDIEQFSFALSEPVASEPGQYALAWLPGVEGPRAYSMSNIDEGHAVWEFQVRRLPEGRGSAALFALQPGQTVALDGPYGMAWLRRDAPRDILCLAGGSGLAPMLSIARGAMHEPRLAQRGLHFLYGGRTRADLCGQDFLAQLPGWGERLHYQGFVSSPGPADAPQDSGFLHDAALRLFGGQLPGMEVYFAGPPAMAAAVQQMLVQAQVPPEQVHFDQFY